MRARWTGVEESKARILRMKNLQRDEVGFRGIEEFVGKLEETTVYKRGQGRLERKIVHLSMRKKIDDEKGRLRRLKREKEAMRRAECVRLGGPRANKYRRRMRTLHRHAGRAAADLHKKYDKKVGHLKEKYETERRKVPMRMREKRPRGKHEEDFPDLLIYAGRELNEQL